MTPAVAGRCAFWDGRPIWANPHVDLQAAEWREAWRAEQAAFTAAGGHTKTDLARLRPADLPRTRVAWRKMTRAGAARKSALLRQAGVGWR